MATNKKLTTPIGKFVAQTEQVIGKGVEAYFGIPYAKSEAFRTSEAIRIYDGTGYMDLPVPQKEEIRAAYESDLFDRLQKDFMRARNQNFVA